jgi:hypothetical protein
VQDTLVILDYERISVNASQALTEANKMGPCLEPWSETTKSWFAYVLILSFSSNLLHTYNASTICLPHFKRLNFSTSTSSRIVITYVQISYKPTFYTLLSTTGLGKMQLSSIPTSSSSYSSTPKSLPAEIVRAYGTWVQQHLDLGWDAYFITFMFRNISGSSEAKVQQMQEEITRFYEKLATRAVRKPRSEKWVHLLPRGVFFPDVPGYKKSFSNIREVTINDGVHFHGIMVTTQEGRLKEPLHFHLCRKRKLYTGGKIYRIDAEQITSRAAFVTDYGGKAIKRKRFSNDHVLLLPRTVAELPAKRCNQVENEEAKALKDIQSSMNVSEAAAHSIHQIRKSCKRR